MTIDCLLRLLVVQRRHSWVWCDLLVCLWSPKVQKTVITTRRNISKGKIQTVFLGRRKRHVKLFINQHPRIYTSHMATNNKRKTLPSMHYFCNKHIIEMGMECFSLSVLMSIFLYFCIKVKKKKGYGHTKLQQRHFFFATRLVFTWIIFN